MPDRLLYNVPIPEGAQLSQSQQQVRQLIEEGTLEAGPDAVEDIAGNPATQSLSGRVRGRHAQLIARMFEELFSADGIEVVPLFVRGRTTTEEDRYVALEDIETDPAHPTDKRIQSFDGSLTTVGTRRSHWRAVKTAVTTETNPFGSGSAEEIAISARASKPRWFDAVDGTLEAASPDRTVESERDKIDIYDITNSTITDPTLIYDLPYRHEWPVDCRVWDDYNRSKYDEQSLDSATVGSATVGDDTGDSRQAVQWQRVFSSVHDYVGRPVVENGRLRLVFDDGRGRLSAYRWDTDNKQYETVQLGNSPWRLYDSNIKRIGVERVDGQIEFEDTSAGALTTYNLDFSLKRGQESVLWTEAENESNSAPSGLVTRLDPIALSTTQDPSGVADIVPRQEVDR